VRLIITDRRLIIGSRAAPIADVRRLIFASGRLTALLRSGAQFEEELPYLPSNLSAALEAAGVEQMTGHAR
jgi:hypothetical protein